MNHLSPFTLLPPSQEVCRECAVEHEPHEPHNFDSLFYKYNIFGKHGRWPNWADAMLHCSEEIKKITTEVLSENGVTVSDEQIANAQKLLNIPIKS